MGLTPCRRQPHRHPDHLEDDYPVGQLQPEKLHKGTEGQGEEEEEGVGSEGEFRGILPGLEAGAKEQVVEWFQVVEGFVTVKDYHFPSTHGIDD